MDTEPQGCLAATLRLFGIQLGGARKSANPLPYRLCDNFLSAAELSFFKVLSTAIAGRFVICCKVRLGDLFYVVHREQRQSFRNKVERKHVDFLLCDPLTMKQLCGVELDDSSHKRADRQARDLFVDEVFRSAKLPLIHIPTARTYRPDELLDRLIPHLRQSKRDVLTPSGRENNKVPTCPKCEIPMVLRIATKGPNAGNKFYGCVNYPQCKQTA